MVPSIAGPEASAGPHRADRRQVGVPQGHPQLRRGEPATPSTPSSTRRSRSRSRPATRRCCRSTTTTTARCPRRPPTRTAGRASRSTVKSEDRGEFVLDHGAVVIAAITSCTNTSNPEVMLGAALLARNAVEKGLTSKPWVKTTMAPGSQVVTDYYDKAGLWPYLEKLGFYLVGYGCTTCIGNCGPLPDEISKAVNDNDLSVAAVLSGNRNFEGRINPDVKMNYLASPPLVIAYALAGTMDFDFESEPLGQDKDGNDVFLRDIWPSQKDISDTIASAINTGDVHQELRRRVQGRRALAQPADPERQHLRLGRQLDVRAQAPVLRRHAGRAGAGGRHHRRQSACAAG